MSSLNEYAKTPKMGPESTSEGDQGRFGVQKDLALYRWVQETGMNQHAHRTIRN